MEHNPIFDTAVDFVNNTSCSIFLTGKAGTGKTTFLKYIRENTKKKSVVVAPTGVAAINAGGVTMHSLFQLPLGPFVPVSRKTDNTNVVDKYSLFKDIRISSEKRDLFRDLELLIIDEVSMVRCDTLDALDAILRYIRRKPHKVFGGVQVLFIGDLFQLPPVMPDGEWSLLREYYASPFFFHSKAVTSSPPVYIELKKIYRQNEERFIDILNRIRNNEATSDDLNVLNKRFGAEPVVDKKYITLTSHNYKADRINQEQLKKLSGKAFDYKGSIDGDFPDKALPTDISLQLKVGAQVMFIRNDKSNERRYFNGKLATVSQISEKEIRVEMNDGSEELQLEKETWDNIRYSYNQDEDRIDEEKLGSFSQYPIRLAWAITIHKSQGLTFEYAIIDAGESFAPGQVYVALSRCVSLDGVILHSKIDTRAISTHQEVIDFARAEKDEADLRTNLEQQKHLYVHARLLDTFDLESIAERIENFIGYTNQKKFAKKDSAVADLRTILRQAQEQQTVAMKFRPQLETLLKEQDIQKLKERVTKAFEYFSSSITDTLLNSLDELMLSLKTEKKIKKYLGQLAGVKLDVAKKLESMQNAKLGEVALNESKEVFAIDHIKEEVKKKTAKVGKGDSVKETLTMFQKGMTLDEIAKSRGLAKGTIETHFLSLIKSGDISVGDFVASSRYEIIKEEIVALGTTSVTSVKQQLPDDFGYNEIRAVMYHMRIPETNKT
jgi:nucleoside-triphosphatase THEP1